MRISELNSLNGTKEHPSDLVARYDLSERNGGTIYSFLSQFDFNSREEIERAVRDIAYAICGDKYYTDKDIQKNDVIVRSVYARFNRLLCSDKVDKYPTAVSGELWHGGYARKKIQEATARLLSDYTPDAAQWRAARDMIASLYSLSDEDMDKLLFFICQVKEGAAFPCSLRRMLYIWGRQKMTGKTTTATMIVSILNGDTDPTRIAHYSSSLAYEMQIKSFAVPKISECNVCLMDECFYADMGKTYSDFKRFLTSAGGYARLPFGQEFGWEGYPNYVATSNDPLKRFIKDWNDRRYLSIEFKAMPTRRLPDSDLYGLWLNYIRGARRSMEWAEWADRIATYSNEVGERSERADEFAIELQSCKFLDYVAEQVLHSDKVGSSGNHISLKFFVDWFARDISAAEANKRREEIEQAVLSVYGERYKGQSWWLLSGIKERAQQLKRELMYGGNDLETTETTNNDLPF